MKNTQNIFLPIDMQARDWFWRLNIFFLVCLHMESEGSEKSLKLKII